jgi:adenine-specific DNA-methyltransferase
MTENLKPEKLELTTVDIAADKQAELLRLFPEVRTEGGKIDFDRLRLALGETVDVGKERYGMNWPGKADCFKAIQRPSLGTLLPVRKESVNFDETENLIIEGDNLEVLKLLQKSYQGKVKMIYIDPPYNTGNDFIYPDDYSDSLKRYLEVTAQVDSEGRRLSNNLESDGRFHSNWLNLMYPRLYLARNLLHQDGVIFISIDDNEIANLRNLCNQIFGEENFVGVFVWRRRASSALAERLVSTDHEYVLAFQRDSFTSFGIPKDFESYTNPDNDPRGPWVSGDLTVGMHKDLRPNQFYTLSDPITGNEFPANSNRVWSYIPESMNKLIAEGRVLFPSDPSRRPMLKRFRSELKADVNPVSTWMTEVGLNTESTRELQELFDRSPFDYSKPSSLLRHLLRTSAGKDDLVLDFFAGSGTTAHALLDINREDGGTRKFILVQLPEPTGRDDFRTIADITKERVRRVIQRHENEVEGKLNLGNQPKEGFRVLKLATSNFNVWSATTETTTPDELGEQLQLHIDHIQSGRTSEDLLYEILLKSGFPLTTPVQPITVEGIAVYSVANGAMLICLDKALTHDAIKGMAELKPERVVCLDEGFAGNDQLKTNAVLIMKAKGVTKFQTV